jgi:hypothetical protein
MTLPSSVIQRWEYTFGENNSATRVWKSGGDIASHCSSLAMPKASLSYLNTLIKRCKMVEELKKDDWEWVRVVRSDRGTINAF